MHAFFYLKKIHLVDMQGTCDLWFCLKISSFPCKQIGFTFPRPNISIERFGTFCPADC